MTTAQAFDKYLVDISPTEYQNNSFIPARRRSVVEDLQKAFPEDSDMPFWYADLMGSAAKGTIIRPFDDIDVLAVFSDENGAASKYTYNSQDFLYRIRKAYDGFKAQEVGARGQAVRVFFEKGGHVDVAPVFKLNDNDFSLPAGDGSWITTSPFVANDWFDAQHRDLNYHLKPLVRLLKSWNRAHSSHFRSFHLETVAAHTFSKLGTNYRNNLAKFFEWAPTGLNVPDPGGHSTDLSTYLTYSGRINLINALSVAEDRAKKAMAAEENGDHEEAIRLWRIILGDDFGR
jgi:hypothetical protein